MQLHPLADRVVAKPIEAETKTAAGFLLAEQSKDKTQLAKVEAIGKEVKEIKVGDTILHTEFGPDRLRQGNDELIVLKEKDVLAIVKA